MALALTEGGQEIEAVRAAMRAALAVKGDRDIDYYRGTLTDYAGQLGEPS